MQPPEARSTSLVLPIEFVDKNQLLGRLHYFKNRLPRIDKTGPRRAVRNPPFCRILRFFRREVFFNDNALMSFLFRRNVVFWRSVSGTFPFITFFAHSLTQSTNSLSHFLTYSRFALSPSLRMRFSTGKYFFHACAHFCT